MSFKPIKFSFTPPPTLAPAPSTASLVTQPAPSSGFGGSIAASSKAAALVTRLNDLSATAIYLQSVLKSLVQTLGVNFDLSADPDLGIALSRIYNTSNPPIAMDMTMYEELLTADINFLRFDLLNPVNSSIQINPIQRADVTLAAKAYENALIGTGVYNQTLPILLRSLAGDQLIFDQMNLAIQKYPILSVPQLTAAQLASGMQPTSTSDRDLNGSSVDVSDSLNDTLNTTFDKWEKSYAGIYNMAAQPDPIETSLPAIASSLSGQPTSDLVRMQTMLQNLIAFVHIPQLQQKHDSAENLIVPRLLSDVSTHSTKMDYFHQVAVGPSSGISGSLGDLLSEMSGINPGQVVSSNLTGLVKAQAGGPSIAPLTTKQSSLLAALPTGLAIFAAHTLWAKNESTRQNNFTAASLQRLGTRKMGNQGDHTELLTSMKSLSSSISIIQSFVSNSTSGGRSQAVAAPAPAQGLQSFSTLIGSLKSQSGSSYALDGNTLVINPPQIPTAPPNVQSTLSRGGVSQFTTNSFRTPVNLGV